MFRRSDGGDSFAKIPSLCGKVLARGKKSFRDGAVRNADRIAAPPTLFAKAHHVQRLANMQGARLAIRSNAIVVEHAVRNVRVLLDFAKHDARAYGVRGSSGNEYSVASLHRDTFKAILDVAVSDSAAK